MKNKSINGREEALINLLAGGRKWERK